MIEYTFLQDIGGRDEQQDSVAIFEINEIIFMIVADGMGGHSGGALASSTLLKIAENNFRFHYKVTQEPYTFFSKIVKETKEKLIHLSKNKNIDPNTTVVFALIKNNTLYYAHMGDSRLYLFEEKNKLVFRTRDHSLPEILFQNNQIKEEEIATHPQQNVLTKSIGVDSNDILTYNQYKLSKYKNYQVLLASDGLWSAISDEEMYHELFSEYSTDITTKRLLETAKYRGGKYGDNISIALLKITNNKKYISYTLPAIIFIITLIIGVYFYSFTNSSKPIITNQDRNTTTPSKQNLTSPINPIDWSTG